MHPVETKSDLLALAIQSPAIAPSPQSERESTDIKNGADSIHWITQDAFSSLLNEVKQELDPFAALESRLNRGRCIVQLTNGASLQCRLETGPWKSTTFAKEEAGDFRYIEAHEYNPVKGVTIGPKALIKIRISLDYTQGEWLGIYKGKKVSGQVAEKLADELSYAMKIEECFLADVSILNLKKIGIISLREPLQVIRGSTFYPKFKVYHTKKPIASAVRKSKDECYTFKQDAEYHRRKLVWLQNMKMEVIRDKILTKCPKKQETLAKQLERNGLSNTTTFQQYMTTLYDKAKSTKQGKQDYLWANIHLITYSAIEGESDLQRAYRRITKALHDNMLFVASFKQ